MMTLNLVASACAGTVLLGLVVGGCGRAGLQPGEDGGVVDAGGDRGRVDASPGMVTLRLSLPASRSFCDQSCVGAAQHISILTADGHAIPIAAPYCMPVCAQGCQEVGCPVGGACLFTGVAVTTAELQWDGRMYPSSTCGAGVTCYQPTFAPAGHYLAHMCATPGAVTSPGDAQEPICTATGAVECVDVPFDLPSGGIVEGTLAGATADRTACGVLRASDFDQSCVLDSDCVAEPEGDFCQPGKCTNCANAAIGASARTMYEAALASSSTAAVCPCPSPPRAICDRGTCALSR